MTAASPVAPARLEWWLGLAAAALIAALSLHYHWTARLDFTAHDLGLTLAPPDSGSSGADIVIVAIDDRSLAAVGPWPWPRQVQAALVDRIASASPRVIGIDVLLSEPREPAGDTALAAALARAGIVVLPTSFTVPGLNGTAFTSAEPLPALAAHARTGHVNLSPDDDGVVRRFYRVYQGNGATWPALPAAMLGQPAKPALANSQTSLTGTDPLLIGWRGPPGSFPTLPASAVLAGEVPASLLAGKFVLVGVAASGLGDVHATPFGGGALMPGVEIQANILATLAGGAAVHPAGAGALLGFTLLPIAVLFGAMRRLSPARVGLTAMLLTLAVALACWAMLHWGRTWFPPVTALAALALSWLAWAWRRLALASRHLARELERAAAEAGPLDAAPMPAASFLDRQIALVEAATRRERKLRAEQDEVVRLLSHDMRAPQGAILSLVGDGQFPVPADAARRIRDHARRTLSLAEGFVQLSRAQLMRFEPHLLDLAELARDAADSLWELSREHGMTIEVNAPDHGEVLVMGEPSLLARMIANLTENALKYGEPGSQVTIQLTTTGDAVLLQVLNNGPDIPAERLDVLFEAFARAPDVARTGGVGLGLAFVHTVAARHGGAVSCRSAGGITAFSVSLPAAQEP